MQDKKIQADSMPTRLHPRIQLCAIHLHPQPFWTPTILDTHVFYGHPRFFVDTHNHDTGKTDWGHPSLAGDGSGFLFVTRNGCPESVCPESAIMGVQNLCAFSWGRMKKGIAPPELVLTY
jgi:hypothetical protein